MGDGLAVGLKSRLPEYQHLQASGPPGLLPFAHMAADKSASLQQKASRTGRNTGRGRFQTGACSEPEIPAALIQHLQASCLPGPPAAACGLLAREPSIPGGKGQ